MNETNTNGSNLMIQVRDLVKEYAGRVAINHLNFDVQHGEIVGFLGPNGAGKSTTMRILSAFMPATSGSVEVAGYDVFRDSKEVRKRIGYMPENNPLYTEMRVTEYLHYRARLKGVPWRRRKDQVQKVKEMCSLVDVEKKIIGHLSKGYRQRVGIADALVHDPQLIILDEPTIGLDPNQIRQVREVIRSLAGNHTVLLSTHILSEVEMTCSRVIIINKGQIVASDTPQNLREMLTSNQTTLVEIRAEESEIRDVWSGMPGIVDIQFEPLEDGFTRYRLTSEGVGDIREEIFHIAAKRGWSIRELSRKEQTLEDVFVRITRPEQKTAVFSNKELESVR